MQTASSNGKEPVTHFESRPSEWVPAATRNGDLGYHGFHPPRPGQDEDVLSEKNIKDGYLAKPEVIAETFPGKDMALVEINQHGALLALQDLMNQVFARRVDLQPGLAPPSFKLPGRVTLNDAKRQAWVADLANPDVPLHKLGRSVPHGFKGHDLLDMLQSNKVAVPRAVWYVRVLGGNETHGMRNRPNFSPSLYSVEWANVITSYLKKQLADIALPSIPRPGLNIKQIFKGVLGEEETRERWIGRFSYTLDLLRTFYSEGMVDHVTFLVWLSQQTISSNMAQAGFIVRIAEEYFDGLLTHRTLMRPLIDGCLSKLSEIDSSSVKEHLSMLATAFINIIQRAFLARPDFFVNARLWPPHHSLLKAILVQESPKAGVNEDAQAQLPSQVFDQVLKANFSNVQGRNDALLFNLLPERPLNNIRLILTDIQILNSIVSTTELATIRLLEPFSVENDREVLFTKKLDVLLTWAVTSLQHGDHRPYVAATLLSQWCDAAEQESADDDFDAVLMLQSYLFDWIDTTCTERSNTRATAILFGQLAKQDIFSVGKYITRLIARGETDLSTSRGAQSPHLTLLRNIPLHNPSPTLLNQRKLALYGIRTRMIPETDIVSKIRRELRATFPEFFGGGQSSSKSTELLRQGLASLLSASPFEQGTAIGQSLVPAIQLYIAERSKKQPGLPVILIETYSILMQLLCWTHCYPLILELNLLFLSQAITNEILLAILDTFRRHLDVWNAMGSLGDIANALFQARDLVRRRGVHLRPLLMLLAELDGGQRLPAESRELVAEDMATVMKAMIPPSFTMKEQVPSVMPEVASLCHETGEDALSDMASRLWLKYSWNNSWVLAIWANTVMMVRQIPSMMLSPLDRRKCAQRYSNFLGHIAQYIPGNFDQILLQWVSGPGRAEFCAYELDSWHVLSGILLGLVGNGTLTCTTVLGGVLYVGWELAASSASQSLDVLVQSVNALGQQLLQAEDVSNDPSSQSSLEWSEFQRLQARRRIVYESSHFPTLVTSLPLLIALEMNTHLNETSRNSAICLRLGISRHPQFRKAVCQNIEIVRNTFLVQELSTPAYKTRLARALRLILNDDLSGDINEPANLDSYNWSKISINLDPWRFSRASIELHITLQQLNDDFAHSETSVKAQKDLEDLATSVFSHLATPGQNDLLADILRGAGGPVTTKFGLSGLDHITRLLAGIKDDLNLQRVKTFFANAGEVLRLIATILQPLRPDHSQLHSMAPAKQISFINVFLSVFENVQATFFRMNTVGQQGGLDDLNSREITNLVILLARILQFDLGVSGPWIHKDRNVAERLTLTLMKMTAIYGRLDELVPFTVLLDTTSYLLDGKSNYPLIKSSVMANIQAVLPKDPKAPNADLSRHLPELDDLVNTMSHHYRSRLRALINFTDHDDVTDLAQASRDASGKVTIGPKVQRRPWEWTENIEGLESATMPIADNEKVKNSASIPLELFRSRTTGEIIIGEQYPSGEPNKLWSFYDSLVTETALQRDWRESKIELNAREVDGAKPKPVGPGSDMPNVERTNEGNNEFMAGSPAATVYSKSSARASSSSRRASPAQSQRTGRTAVEREVIDVDSVVSASSTRGSKRKASSTSSAVAVDDEEDVIVLEGPSTVTTRGGTAKRARGRATTGGKTNNKKK